MNNTKKKEIVNHLLEYYTDFSKSTSNIISQFIFDPYNEFHLIMQAYSEDSISMRVKFIIHRKEELVLKKTLFSSMPLNPQIQVIEFTIGANGMSQIFDDQKQKDTKVILTIDRQSGDVGGVNFKACSVNSISILPKFQERDFILSPTQEKWSRTYEADITNEIFWAPDPS